MSALRILVYGTHPEIVATVLRVINREEAWQAWGSVEEGALMSLARQRTYDLVLLGAGLDAREEQKVRAALEYGQPGIPIVQHFGGGSGLLKSEIEGAIGRRPHNSP